MIKSDKGELAIDGNNLQVLLDFAHIYEEMIKIAPEVVQAVVIRYQDDLLNAKVDRIGFAICEKILNVMETTESEDEDNESPIL